MLFWINHFTAKYRETAICFINIVPSIKIQHRSALVQGIFHVILLKLNEYNLQSKQKSIVKQVCCKGTPIGKALRLLNPTKPLCFESW